MGIFREISKFRKSIILITAPILLLFLFIITSPDIYRVSRYAAYRPILHFCHVVFEDETFLEIT